MYLLVKLLNTELEYFYKDINCTWKISQTSGGFAARPL